MLKELIGTMLISALMTYTLIVGMDKQVQLEQHQATLSANR